MDDISWNIFILAGVVALWLVIRRRYRHRTAGKLADQLLKDIIKGKDAFRR